VHGYDGDDYDDDDDYGDDDDHRFEVLAIVFPSPEETLPETFSALL
jgi:hypothetical protein